MGKYIQLQLLVSMSLFTIHFKINKPTLMNFLNYFYKEVGRSSTHEDQIAKYRYLKSEVRRLSHSATTRSIEVNDSKVDQRQVRFILNQSNDPYFSKFFILCIPTL